MNHDEHDAPDWVKNDEELKPISKKQKVWFLVVLTVVIPFCLWAGWFEFNRAQEGRWRAWVYAFEWPFFAVVAVYMYRRLLRGDRIKIPRPKNFEIEDEE